VYKLKNSLVALGGVSLLIGVIALVTPRPTQGQGGDTVGPTKPVKVVNTAAEPVPVTGTINVGNFGDSPLPVRDVDSPGRQLVRAGESCSGSGCSATVFTVPAGKRLVIEYASIEANIPLGKMARWQLLTNSSGIQNAEFNFPLTQPAVVFGAITQVTAGQQVRFYAEAGDAVRMGGATNDSAQPSNYNFAISGYLVDVP